MKAIDEFYNKIEAAILSATMKNVFTDDEYQDEHLPLVDFLSTDETIKSGKEEIQHLADHVFDETESDLTALIEDACRERTFDFLKRFFGIIPGDATVNAVYDKYYSITNKPKSDENRN